jgi:hypothetical protein
MMMMTRKKPLLKVTVAATRNSSTAAMTAATSATAKTATALRVGIY